MGDTCSLRYSFKCHFHAPNYSACLPKCRLRKNSSAKQCNLRLFMRLSTPYSHTSAFLSSPKALNSTISPFWTFKNPILSVTRCSNYFAHNLAFIRLFSFSHESSSRTGSSKMSSMPMISTSSVDWVPIDDSRQSHPRMCFVFPSFTT